MIEHELDSVLTDLPDVSITERSPSLSALQWVGMQGMDLPIRIVETGCRETHARADVQVDLPAAHVKGIHMSRLYRLMDGLDAAEAVTPALMRQVLQAMVDSHQDCETTSARLRLFFDLASLYNNDMNQESKCAPYQMGLTLRLEIVPSDTSYA